MRRGFWRAWGRLLAVQGAWNYERMTGVGLGYAAEPLLEELRSVDPIRHSEAQVRAAEYFNSHPYLSGLALGAQVRAEEEGVPGERIARLRTALTGPLGALGDQFFWAGLVPVAMALAVAGVALGYPGAAFALIVPGYALFRLWTGYWSLRAGLTSGPQIGTALGGSWLTRWSSPVGNAAGFLVGVAIPLAAVTVLSGAGGVEVLVTVVTTGLGLAAGRVFGQRVTSVRFGLAAIMLGILLWSLR
jgi:PTS system mannose-specific IID component